MPPEPQTFSHYPTWPLPVLHGPRPSPNEAPRPAITGRSVCGYLPGRKSMFRAFEAEELSPQDYRDLLDAGFRRSGTLIYQPMCPGCRQCQPIRVPTARFTPTKSHRRVLRKNADLMVTVTIPTPTLEKYELYDRYQRRWHDGKQAGDPVGFLSFLYHSPVHTLEFEYRNPAAGLGREGKLLGVGICDLLPQALSSVYFYFDPAEAHRSPGTFSALYELAWAKEHHLPHWYAGYWIQGCRTMEYKANYRPAELLGTDGIWREMPPASADSSDPCIG